MTEKILSPQQLADLVSKIIDDNKGEDVLEVDLMDKSSIADYMIIASGTGARHIQALASYIEEAVRPYGIKPLSIEKSDGWILVDLDSVLVHLFSPEVRSFYNLEELWMQHAPQSS